MTAGNNGANPPEADDPFGYLYRSEDGAPTQAQQQPGVPRTSYNQVRSVGERRYGQQAQQAQQAPNAHYAAPETQPGGRDASRQTDTGSGRPPQKRNGLLIGALAVVAAVIIGVGAAVVFSDDDAANANQSASSGGQQSQEDEDKTDEDQAGQDDKGEDKDGAESKLPSEDASSLRVDNGPAVASDIKGSKATNGDYVGGFNKEGATATWATDVPRAGKYTVYIGYTVPGQDASATLTVNGEVQTRSLNMQNFAGAGKGDWDKGWTSTYAWITLPEGANSIQVSCGSGDNCDFALDRLWLKAGHVSG